MKKILFLFVFLFISFLGNSQTTTITPTLGASSQSIQAIETNTLTRMWVAMTSTPGIYVSVTGGTVTLIPSGTQSVVVTGSVNAVPAITALALTSSSASTSQTIAAGAKVISIETSSDYVGNIDGVAGNASSVYPFSSGPNGTLPQIIVTVSAGSIRIRKLQ